MPSQFSTQWINNHTATPLRKPSYYDMQSSEKNTLCTMVSSTLPSTKVTNELEMANRMVIMSKTALVNHCAGKLPPKNGVVKAPPATTTIHPRTEGQHTNSEQESLTCDGSNHRRLVYPELSLSYTKSVMGKRSVQLYSRQQGLESRLASLQRQLRTRQLSLVNRHARMQMKSHEAVAQTRKMSQSSPVLARKDGVDSLSQMDSEPLLVRQPEHGTMIQVDGAPANPLTRTEYRRVDSIATTPSDGGTMSLDGGMMSLDGGMMSLDGGTMLDESPFASFSSESSHFEEDVVPVATQIQQQLECLEGMVEDDLTESSSDEEEWNETWVSRHDEIKKTYEHARVSVGCRWQWLERRIAELNKQVCQLDNTLQRRPGRQRFVHSYPDVIPPSYTYPLPNGSLVGQLQRGGNGSLIAAGLSKGKVVNGFNHHPVTASSFPHLLLPDGAKLQVKDLLSPSPIGRNFSMLLDEGGTSASRTRPLERKALRRIVRMRGEATEQQTLDNGVHPKLSLPEELPSRILLDATVRQITQEHSYATLPLSKRRRLTPSLTPVRNNFIRLQNSYDHRSGSLSPTNTSSSSDRTPLNKVIRRKHGVSDSLPGSPSLLPYPVTPIFTPLSRKRRSTISTPSFDIDNIVIPYSVASSTRPEKLEYKEIITPSWREVGGPVIVNGRPLENHCDNEEDFSDEAFTVRHGKCEMTEKRRFLNFISGGGSRKRGRTQSAANTPDGIASPKPLYSRERDNKHHVPQTFTETEGYQSHVLPWLPRTFPLGEKDLDALHNPVPPPKPILASPSPSPMLTPSPALITKMHTPLSSCSTLATPLSSPMDESPLLSPSEWTVITPQVDALSSLVLRLGKKS